MNNWRAPHAGLVSAIAIFCCLVLVAGVIWASDRAFEFTDESYYLLSAIYPDQVTLYISAQHWVLAPLWDLTKSLQGFRLTGAIILVGSAVVLAFGVIRSLEHLTDRRLTPLTSVGIAAAGGVGALLYVATIAPSPSYNLLASSGAYAGTGFALLGVWRRRLAESILLSLLGGFCLAVVFLCKASAGICVGLTVVALLLALENKLRIWLLILTGLLGVLATLACFVLLQPAGPSVQDSLRGGLELFRMVQTESVWIRLIRYSATLTVSIGQAALSFLPTILFATLLKFYPFRWLGWLTLCLLVVNIFFQGGYLAGATGYVRMAGAIYVITLMLLILGFVVVRTNRKVALLVVGITILPFSIAMGTGNSLFTQVIVSMAPWTIIATLLVAAGTIRSERRILQRGATVVLLALITVQITGSYMRDPYHLPEPLTGQSTLISLGVLGPVKVDSATAKMVTDIEQAATACALKPGAQFLGFFNVPGLALVFDAIPPVTPWLNNPVQAATILRHWNPETASRVITVLTPGAKENVPALPSTLRPDQNGSVFCGYATLPYDKNTIEIWASKVK